MNQKTCALAALAASVSMISVPPAQAGYSSLSDGMCVAMGFGSYTCFGTFAGIRGQTVDATRSAHFTIDDLGIRRFEMMIKGVSRACTAPASMKDVWSAALGGATSFSIVVNTTTGICTRALVMHGSQYRNATAL